MAGMTVAVEGRRRLAIGAAVAVLHVAALIWLGLSVAPTLPEVTAQAFDVVLMRPGPRLDLDRDSPEESGGAPAAPSSIHATPEPRLEEVELTAPSEPAPLQPLVLGLSPLATPSPAFGNGGAGEGTGSGVGSGAGAGGGGTVLIRGPAGAVITEGEQSADLVRDGRVHVILRCRILQNQRLAGCRVIREHPQPSGYRRAAMQCAREFRIRQFGVIPRGGRTVTVACAFPPPEPEPATAPVDGN